MIREACAGDAGRVAEILIFTKRTAYRDIFRNDRVSFGEMQVLPLALRLRDEPGALAGVLVCEEDGVLKGMARLRPCGAEAELSELYVDPFFQGQGIGPRLIGEAVRRAGEQSVLFLWVLERNARARRFYERQGFVPTGEREREPGTEEDCLRYERRRMPSPTAR